MRAMPRPPSRPNQGRPAKGRPHSPSKGPHQGREDAPPRPPQAERKPERQPERPQRAPQQPALGRAAMAAPGARQAAQAAAARQAASQAGRGARPPQMARAPQMLAAESTPRGTYWLYGLHPVQAALANPRRTIRRLLLTQEAHTALVRQVPLPWSVIPEQVDKAHLSSFLPADAVHQGTVALVEPLEEPDWEAAITRNDGPVLVLDQVTDPRNVGAILRSAAAFGAACVIMQDRHAPPETGALARAASGTLETVPVLREVNLSRALEALKKAGFWVLGLDGDGIETLAEAAPRDRRVVLVLGAEGDGMRRLTREACDVICRLPISPEVESLNVSAAASVALYEFGRTRK